MKLITKKTDYAMRALCFLAKDRKQMFSTAEVSRELKIPRQFLRRIFQILQKEGVLHSYEGKTGGFQLAVPANKIWVVDLIKIFQGPVQLNDCFIKKDLCPDVRRCRLRQTIKNIEKYVNRKFQSLTIASLVKKR